MGGFMLNNTGGTIAATTPAMECDEAEVSLSFTIGRNRFTAPVQETRDGQTLAMGEYAMPRNGNNQYLVLFSSKRLGPGNVAGASLWLKADAGVTKTSGKRGFAVGRPERRQRARHPI